MTEEYQASTDLSSTTDGQDAETLTTSKDEQVTANEHENDFESECSSSTRSEEDIACSALEVEADAFTRFIERQRLEVMTELRRLRLGERPVTGQNNRVQIETFFSNVNEQQQQQDTRVPSTRPIVPSAHMTDINALANRRCVSLALGSSAFRQDLENTIRRTIGARPVAPAQVSPPARVGQSGQQSIPRRIQAPIEQQPPIPTLNIQRQEREFDSWEAISQLQRERIVLEISDLVHRQLVTSSLESDFRRHLEQSVLQRFRRGAPSEQQTQTTSSNSRIPPPPARPPLLRSNVPLSTTNSDELSSRLDSMQQMLQLMFSMQMDMQRSLRQDIASALDSRSAMATNAVTQPVQAGRCTICLNAIADTALYRCGHLCVCYMCALQLQQGVSAYGIKCPICRAPVEDILRVYRSSPDEQ